MRGFICKAEQKCGWRDLNKTSLGGLGNRQKERGPGECATRYPESQGMTKERKWTNWAAVFLSNVCRVCVILTNLLVNSKPDSLETSHLCLFLPSSCELFPTRVLLSQTELCFLTFKILILCEWSFLKIDFNFGIDNTPL